VIFSRSFSARALSTILANGSGALDLFFQRGALDGFIAQALKLGKQVIA
jgi:hypothetical protein